MDPADPSNRQAERLALFTRWADDLAHEIKNPLHAMVINLELVKRKATRDPDAVVERAEVVERELNRVHLLIDSLLRMIRPWPDAGTTALHDVVSPLLPVMTARASLQKVQLAHEQGEAHAAIRPAAFVHLLIALVDRAIDAASPGGTVTLRIASEPRPTVTLGVEGGRGEPHDGAALATARALVAQAGGSLRVSEDADQHRAEVEVELPPTASA